MDLTKLRYSKPSKNAVKFLGRKKASFEALGIDRIS